MSSSGQGAPGDKKDEPKGLKKFMRRASLVLKPKSKRQSVSGSSASAPKDSSAAAMTDSTAPASPPATASSPTKSDTIPTLSVPAQITQVIKDNKPGPTPVKARVGMSAKEVGALQEEKARAMFAKYGLTLEPGEWTTPVTGGAPRVEKHVRMRIHRACHRCQTTFGSDRVCNNCQHTRCKKCPRFPASKPKVAKGKGAAAGGVMADDSAMKGGGALTMPQRGTGKEMTRRLPTQRVRRTCHECQTLFTGKAVQCENCKHMRCAKCPRDPPKTQKYPEGYPGDTQERSASGGGDTKAIRTPGETQQVENDVAIQSVEERMKNLDVSPQASAA